MTLIVFLFGGLESFTNNKEGKTCNFLTYEISEYCFNPIKNSELCNNFQRKNCIVNRIIETETENSILKYVPAKAHEGIAELTLICTIILIFTTFCFR